MKASENSPPGCTVDHRCGLAARATPGKPEADYDNEGGEGVE
jgi:hypothetical protein